MLLLVLVHGSLHFLAGDLASGRRTAGRETDAMGRSATERSGARGEGVRCGRLGWVGWGAGACGVAGGLRARMWCLTSVQPAALLRFWLMDS